MSESKSTSWESVGKWYQQSVGEEGHYYHQHVVIPGALKLLALNENSNLLDVACGQGILARSLPKSASYLGIDVSPSLIKEAKRISKNPKHEYLLLNATQPLKLDKKFSHAAILLALQNIEKGDAVLKNVSSVLEKNGKLLIVLNHPCFRIPRQSSWQVDQSKKLQYRRIDSYGSELQVPIQAHPSKGENSASTWTFHHPLSTYTQWLADAGFHIVLMEEWYSNKVSTGGAAKMENRSRKEIPLFLAILATAATR